MHLQRRGDWSTGNFESGIAEHKEVFHTPSSNAAKDFCPSKERMGLPMSANRGISSGPKAPAISPVQPKGDRRRHNTQPQNPSRRFLRDSVVNLLILEEEWAPRSYGGHKEEMIRTEHADHSPEPDPIVFRTQEIARHNHKQSNPR